MAAGRKEPPDAIERRQEPVAEPFFERRAVTTFPPVVAVDLIVMKGGATEDKIWGLIAEVGQVFGRSIVFDGYRAVDDSRPRSFSA